MCVLGGGGGCEGCVCVCVCMCVCARACMQDACVYVRLYHVVHETALVGVYITYFAPKHAKKTVLAHAGVTVAELDQFLVLQMEPRAAGSPCRWYLDQVGHGSANVLLEYFCSLLSLVIVHMCL
jgi:hypothetical protein